MVRESGFNPAAMLIHVLGIAAGIFLGFLAMGAIAPDLPAESEAPGVSSSVEPEAVARRRSRLALPAAQPRAGATRARRADGGRRGDPAPADHSRLARGPDGERGRRSSSGPRSTTRLRRGSPSRPRPSAPGDARGLRLLRPRRHPRRARQWYAQIDINVTDVSPPWTYTAPAPGAPASRGRPAAAAGRRRARAADRSAAVVAGPSAVIDTHCHLGLCEPDDAELGRRRARGGRRRMLTVGIDEATSRDGDRRGRGPRGVWAAVGRHPNGHGFDDAPPRSSRRSPAPSASPRSARPASTSTATAPRARTSTAPSAPRSRSPAGSASRS